MPEQVHYLGHQDALKPSLTATENLTFWGRYLGGGGASATAALETVGLAAVADLPAAWNERYRKYLGVTPPNDAVMGTATPL